MMDYAHCKTDPAHEKTTRGYIRSSVEKALAPDVTVIVDSMNYIKGFRYELYCLARSAKTTNCLLYVNTPHDVCKQLNASREGGYGEEL